MLLCAVTHPWPQRLDGRPPSSRCGSPLVAATLARAACARSVGRRVRDGSTLGRRSTRRPSPPALNAARLLRRASLRSHTPVAATARRPPAVESLLLAARRGDARARCSRPLGRPPRSRRLDTRRRSARRPSPHWIAARLLRRASLRGHTPVAATARRPPAVESLLLAARRGDARARCSRPLGRTPRSRRLDTRPPLDAAAAEGPANSSVPKQQRVGARRRVPLEGN